MCDVYFCTRYEVCSIIENAYAYDDVLFNILPDLLFEWMLLFSVETIDRISAHVGRIQFSIYIRFRACRRYRVPTGGRLGFGSLL